MSADADDLHKSDKIAYETMKAIADSGDGTS